MHQSSDRRSLKRSLPSFAAVAAAVSLAAASAAWAADPPRYDLHVSRVCDQTLCYVVWGQVDSDGDGYNDADEKVAGQFVITNELVDQVIRGLGAVVTPVDRGSDPVTDGQGPQDPGSITPIALIDDQTGTPTLILSPPRVTKAQPEVHPGLPNPRVAIGSMPGRAPCTIGCSVSQPVDVPNGGRSSRASEGVVGAVGTPVTKWGQESPPMYHDSQEPLISYAVEESAIDLARRR